MMKKSLFKDFEPVSAKAWKQKIQVDLKGADYNDTLIWESLEGIHVKPFYHQDNFDTSFHPIPGQPTSWNIGQHFYIDDEVITNKLAVNAVSRGAESLFFSAHSIFDYKTICKELLTSEITIYVHLQFLDATFAATLKDHFSNKKAELKLLVDIIGNYGVDGNWYKNHKEDFEITSEILKTTPTALFVDTSHYQNAGANLVQQIAYASSPFLMYSRPSANV